MKSGKIGFIVSQRYLKDQYPESLIQLCREQGHHVEMIVPEYLTTPIDQVDFDCSIYVHRNHSQIGLGLLAKAEKNAKLVNSLKSVLLCQNKFLTSGILSHKELLIPAGFVGNWSHIEQMDERHFPLILKPINGNNGEYIHIIRSKEDLMTIDIDLSHYFIQKYIENDGFDIKLYYIDGDVYAIQKTSPIHQDKEKRCQLIPCTPELKKIAGICSKLFDLNVFGVDTVISFQGDIYVIEVNECSSFNGVPEAPERIYGFMKKLVNL